MINIDPMVKSYLLTSNGGCNGGFPYSSWFNGAINDGYKP